MKPGLFKKINCPENIVDWSNLIQSFESSTFIYLFISSVQVWYHGNVPIAAQPVLVAPLKYFSNGCLFSFFSVAIPRPIKISVCMWSPILGLHATGLDLVLSKCSLISSFCYQKTEEWVCFLPKDKAELHSMFCLTSLVMCLPSFLGSSLTKITFEGYHHLFNSKALLLVSYITRREIP